ncbi:MAG: hypothetical protein JWR54_1217 [Mucilaginibacter sp.]|nr:hypothetical protein [Mucilaginibacter sp.]
MDLLLCKNKPSEKTGFITYQKQIRRRYRICDKVAGANLQVFMFLRESIP